MEAMATFVQNFNHGQSSQNREEMLMLLLQLKQSMDAVKLQKKAAVEKAKRSVAVASEGAQQQQEGSKKQRCHENEMGLLVQRKEMLQVKVEESRLWEQHARLEMQLKDEAMRQAFELHDRGRELAMKDIEVQEMVVRAEVERKKKADDELAEAELERKKKAAIEASKLKITLEDAEMMAATAREMKAKALMATKEKEGSEAVKAIEKKEMAKKQATERASAKKAFETEKKMHEAALAHLRQMEEFEDAKAAKALERKQKQHEMDMKMATERRAFVSSFVAPFGLVEDNAAAFPILTIHTQYFKTKKQFKLVKPSDLVVFLKKSGTIAAAAYRLKWGKDPAQVKEKGFDVYSYPRDEEELVNDALCNAYRQVVAGSSQPGLNFHSQPI